MSECIFCKISQGGGLEPKPLRESELAVIIPDIRPSAPVHYLVIPKRHIASIADITEADEVLIGSMIHMAKEAARDLNLSGYKLVFNVGRDGGQVVEHIHLHILGGWSKEEKPTINV